MAGGGRPAHDPEGLCELGLWRHANYRADGRDYLKRAARLGHGYAAYRLGLSQLQHGRRRAARRWWAIGAGHGRAEATDALEVSDALRRPRSARRVGAGGEDDAGKEPAWWLDALRDRDSDAVYIYAKVESQHLKRQANDRSGKDPTGGPTWRRAAALGDRVVYWCLGCLAARRGRLGEAWLWLAASAAHHDAKAMYDLGLIAAQCSERDVAIGWFQRADQAGHPDAARARRQLLAQRR